MIDERTSKYFDKIKSDVGFLRNYSGEELSLNELLKRSGESNIIKPKLIWDVDNHPYTTKLWGYDITDGSHRYCAEVWVRYSADGLYTHTYIMSKQPSESQVMDIHLIISEIIPALEDGDYDPIRECDVCGKHHHWLDKKSDTIAKKWSDKKSEGIWFCDCEQRND